MAAVEAVVFDWAGTLTPWADADVAGYWDAAARAVDAGLAERHGAALLAAERELAGRCRTELCSATLEQVFELAGVACTAAAKAAYFRAWERHTLLDPAGPGVLRGLRERGIRVGVLSNTMWPRERHEEIFRRDGVLPLLDAAVYSSEIPWSKPHPEAFRAALRALGDVPAARAVYVGDRLFEDIHGAHAAGMRAVHVPHSNIPEHELGSAEGRPDATVRSLAELLPLVDRWNAEGRAVSRPAPRGAARR
ncbi:HAD family hydrolase [Saccharothrix australiensis]|uniref:Putative hydrolase of the HAD superfamily n=1 Tax=Saccharothrix australiensis TaxID=2072 RepID=A0A495VYA8_9PSEU|nr:HAD family hydrolase [Saccharothrix australiensis]RKT53820.1 putative hydrolase of the HAD superfamily [Saccharothrix australiensis]